MIGGSEAAAAVGLDPYRSRIDLWAEKTRLAEPRPTSEAMAWGTILQPVIAAEVEARGYLTLPAPDAAVLGPEPWMVSHPDGYCSNGDDSRGILEIKTCGPFVKGWEDDGAPVGYICQVHHYMAATGLEWALLACLVAGQRLELRRIERDDSLLALLLEAEAEFIGYCQSGKPPAPDGSDAATEVIKRLHPRPNAGEAIELTADDMLVVGELRALKQAAKETDRQIAEREQALKLRLGDAEFGTYCGTTEVRWQLIQQQRKAQAERTIEFRRFTV